jgi:hypothetical protein
MKKGVLCSKTEWSVGRVSLWVASMLSEYLWYALIGLLVVLAFVGALFLNIRYERARRRAEAALTPEQRKERDVRANAAKEWSWF